jgi:hypothetical protein
MYQMNLFFRACVTLALALAFAPFTSCYGADRAWPFIFDGGRLIVKSTPEELSEAKSMLARVDEKHIPDDMLGGVLFDGEVTERLPDDKFGQPAWLMKPTHFILGSDKVRADGVSVISPRIEDGGVLLNSGAKYRIFTVNIEGRFYIWKAVVIELGK